MCLQAHRSCRLGSQHGLRCEYTTILRSVTNTHTCWRISHRKTMLTCVDMAWWNAWIALCSCSLSPTPPSRFCVLHSIALSLHLLYNRWIVPFVRGIHSCQPCNLIWMDFNDANWKFQCARNNKLSLCCSYVYGKKYANALRKLSAFQVLHYAPCWEWIVLPKPSVMLGNATRWQDCTEFDIRVEFSWEDVAVTLYQTLYFNLQVWVIYIYIININIL